MKRLARWPDVRLAVLLAAALLPSTATADGLQVRQARGSSLFAETHVLEFTLTAPFRELFSRAQQAPDAHVEGSLWYVDAGTGRRILLQGVEVSVRGNTSRRETECSFPKLRLRFPKHGDVEASIFRGLRTVKIGTHCDELPDGQLTFQFGRWGNEKSPFREGLVYRLLQAANVPIPASRLARITYIDGAAVSAVGRPDGSVPAKTRNALLLEDEADTMARLGAIGELIVPGSEPAGGDREPAGTFDNAERQFSAADSVRVALAQAMIGNFDWALKFNAGDGYRDDGRKGLWNVLALARRDRTAFPLIYDFDLSGIVTGRHLWYGDVFPDRFAAADTHAAVEVLAQVQRTRSLFDRAVLDAARVEFMNRRNGILAAVDEGPVDPVGTANARLYVEAFFKAIGSDSDFYVPVVVRTGAVPYASADGLRPACGAGDTVPIGSPVVPAPDRSEHLARVAVLDVFWHWAAGRCKAIRQGPVWMDPATVERVYPAR